MFSLTIFNEYILYSDFLPHLSYLSVSLASLVYFFWTSFPHFFTFALFYVFRTLLQLFLSCGIWNCYSLRYSLWIDKLDAMSPPLLKSVSYKQIKNNWEGPMSPFLTYSCLLSGAKLIILWVNSGRREYWEII